MNRGGCAESSCRKTSWPLRRHHGLGVAVTADGAVWTWGEALGRYTRPIPALQFCSHVLKRIGVRVPDWGESGPVMLKDPSRLAGTASP